MAPIRRYLRITKYSVLECRIYLDNPALGQSWLLNPRNPVLPRVIESVRPLVLPKLREERERAQSKRKNKKRSIKDVIIQDDFEVSIFLMETDTRHSLLHKHKHFRDKTQTKLTSNSSKLTRASRDAPIDVDDGGEQLYNADEADDVPILLREESDDQDAIDLNDVPTMDETAANDASANRRPKRRRRGQPSGDGQGPESDNQSGDGNDDVAVEAIGDADSSDDQLFVSSGDSDSDGLGTSPPPLKRRKEKASAGEDDKKKKLAMDISYEGFAIYGRVLCLVVKRRDGGGSKGGIPSAVPPSSSKSQTGRPGGQAMMENWISSTQIPEAAAVEDDVA